MKHVNPLDIRFASIMHAKIIEWLQAEHTNLANGGGSFIREDAAATGMNYAKKVGEIKGLKDVLELIDEIEKELTGKAEKKKGD